MEKLQDFNNAALAPGVRPAKTKELIALDVALTTQSSYCLEIHRAAALKACVTQEEIAEVIIVAAALRTGGAIMYGTQLMG